MAPSDAAPPPASADDSSALSPELLEMLRCPQGSRAPLEQVGSELWCRECRVAYPIQDGLPVILIDEARPLSDADLASR